MPRNLLVLLTIASLLATARTANAEVVGTAFTYQGSLSHSSFLPTALYDFIFILYDDPSIGVQVGGTNAQNDVSVVNGLFTVTLDFGNVFNGDAGWLEIEVREAGVGNFEPLSPRQEISPVPNAVFA